MLLNANSWKRKYIISSTGTERKNSTTTPQTQRIGPLCESRPMPKTIPKTIAATIETAAALSVLMRPGTT